MRQWMMTLAAGLGLALLTACGHAPETAPGISAVSVSAKKTAAKSVVKATPKPVASPKPAEKPAEQPAAQATPAPEAPAVEDGTIKLAVNVSGNAKVASLVLKVFEQADAANALSVPLTVSNGTATWNQADVPAGRYTIQVQALDADKAVLGSGNTEATVTAGQTSDVSLDLRVNTVEAESVPSQGGTIGLTVEIL